MLKSLTSNAEYEARKAALVKDWDSIKSPRSRNKFATGHYGAVDFDGKVMTFDLPPGYKQTGATFDHFGMLGIMKEGNPATVYFDDLAYDGKSEDFANDPGWCSASNLSGGGTGWLVTSGNVVPGETIEVRFDIWDTGDPWYDSVVLLDNFTWSVTASEPGTHQ